MKKFSFKKLIAGILCIAALLLMPLQSLTVVNAADENNREGSLSIFFHHEDRAIGDAAFRIYRVADLKQDGSYTLTNKFSDYSVSLESLDSQSN